VQPESGVTVAACDLSKPFSAPVPVPGDAVNGAGFSFDFRLSPDELRGYFASNRDGVYQYTTDIYEVTRATRDGVFEGAVLQGLSNYPNDPVDSPNVSADALTMYFVGTVGFLDGKQEQPRVATRPNVSGVFAHATPLPIPRPLNTHFNASLYLLPDGLVAYFVQSSPIAQLNGIAVARRLSTSEAFGSPEVVLQQADLGGVWLETVVVTPDQLTMFVGASTPMSHVWVATRARLDVPFSIPHPVHELDSAGGESPSWISADGCRLYMRRGILDDAGAIGTSRVYFAARPPK
jgi:hypothetical protein